MKPQKVFRGFFKLRVVLGFFDKSQPDKDIRLRALKPRLLTVRSRNLRVYSFNVLTRPPAGPRVGIRSDDRQPHPVHHVRSDGGGHQQARLQSTVGGHSVTHAVRGPKDVSPDHRGPFEVAAAARHPIVLREKRHHALGVSKLQISFVLFFSRSSRGACTLLLFTIHYPPIDQWRRFSVSWAGLAHS